MNRNNRFKKSRISTILRIVISIIIALSVFALYQAVNAYLLGNSFEGNYLLMTSISSLIISAYMVFQNRKKIQQTYFKPIKVTTTAICKKCGLKRIGDFEKGDYIMKKTDTCQECNENMLITSIYTEQTKKTTR